MYTYFVKTQGYNLLGDKEQFFGARKLWSKLSTKLDLTVDIINTELIHYLNIIVYKYL